MPLVTIDIIEGAFNAEQKQQMLKEVTNAMVLIEGENLRSVTWIKINEIKSGDWSIGGKSLSCEHIKSIANANKSS